MGASVHADATEGFKTLECKAYLHNLRTVVKDDSSSRVFLNLAALSLLPPPLCWFPCFYYIGLVPFGSPGDVPLFSSDFQLVSVIGLQMSHVGVLGYILESTAFTYPYYFPTFSCQS